MDATTAIVTAIITAFGAVLVGWFSLRAAAKASAAKERADENANALAAWRELVQPLRDEVARLAAQLDHEREEHAQQLAALREGKKK